MANQIHFFRSSRLVNEDNVDKKPRDDMDSVLNMSLSGLQCSFDLSDHSGRIWEWNKAPISSGERVYPPLHHPGSSPPHSGKAHDSSKGWNSSVSL